MGEWVSGWVYADGDVCTHTYIHTYIQMASRLIHLRSETVNERAKER